MNDGSDGCRELSGEGWLAVQMRDTHEVVDDALDRLAEADAQAAELVKLRYFAGLSIPEAAEVLHIGARSADRLWAYARAWLRQAIADP